MEIKLRVSRHRVDGVGRSNFDFHIGMELGRERIKIVCYPHDGKGGPKVASAYIELA